MCFSITLRISVCYELYDVCDSELNSMLDSEQHDVCDSELNTMLDSE